MSIEMVLGIIGTITGIVGTITAAYSVYLSRKRMKRENPDLHVQVLDCKHKVSSDQTSTNLKVEYIVHNKGDRGTKLSKIETCGTNFNGLEHHDSQDLFIDYLDAHNSTKKIRTLVYFKPSFQYLTKCLADS